MWVLTLRSKDGSANVEEKKFYLTLRKPEFIVGRSNADWIILNDSTISRKHATLHIGDRQSCPETVSTRTGIWLTDSGSKYGTFFRVGKDWVKLTPDSKQMLSHGSCIRFGILTNIWSCEYRQMLACASMLPAPQKTDLRNKLTQLDGELLPNFDARCNLVIAERMALTPKVLLALIYGIPIVTLNYLDKVIETIKVAGTWPNPREFLPSISELSVRVDAANFDYKQKRLTLFAGFHFYMASSSQMSNYQTILEAAGAKVQLLENVQTSRLLEKGAVVVDPPLARSTQSQLPRSETAASQHPNDLLDFLDKNGRRSIPESEIPLAITYASTSKFCNVTCFEFSARHSVPVPDPDPNTIIEDHSEAIVPSSGKPMVVVSQSLDLDDAPSTAPLRIQEKASRASTSHASQKRPGSVDILDDIPSKRRIVEAVVPGESKGQQSEAGRRPSTESVKSAVTNIGSRRPSTTSTISDFWSNPKKAPSASKPSRILSPIADSVPATPTAPSTVEKRKLPESAHAQVMSKKPRTENEREVVPIRIPTQPIRQTPDNRQNTTVHSYERHPDSDEYGFIDMSHRKYNPETDALNSTIIMLSLVTLAAQYQTHATTTTSANSSAPNGLRNVKVFKKQHVIQPNRVVELDEPPPRPKEFARPR